MQANTPFATAAADDEASRSLGKGSKVRGVSRSSQGRTADGYVG